jgi:hypothetical protein
MGQKKHETMQLAADNYYLSAEMRSQLIERST